MIRSLRDPIDTTTPQGMFSLQVLGAVAQLEWALIAELTKRACAPATRTPSARSEKVVTPRISMLCWRRPTPARAGRLGLAGNPETLPGPDSSG